MAELAPHPVGPPLRGGVAGFGLVAAGAGHLDRLATAQQLHQVVLSGHLDVEARLRRVADGLRLRAGANQAPGLGIPVGDQVDAGTHVNPSVCP